MTHCCKKCGAKHSNEDGCPACFAISLSQNDDDRRLFNNAKLRARRMSSEEESRSSDSQPLTPRLGAKVRFQLAESSMEGSQDGTEGSTFDPEDVSKEEHESTTEAATEAYDEETKASLLAQNEMASCIAEKVLKPDGTKGRRWSPRSIVRNLSCKDGMKLLSSMNPEWMLPSLSVFEDLDDDYEDDDDWVLREECEGRALKRYVKLLSERKVRPVLPLEEGISWVSVLRTVEGGRKGTVRHYAYKDEEHSRLDQIDEEIERHGRTSQERSSEWWKEKERLSVALVSASRHLINFRARDAECERRVLGGRVMDASSMKSREGSKVKRVEEAEKLYREHCQSSASRFSHSA